VTATITADVGDIALALASRTLRSGAIRSLTRGLAVIRAGVVVIVVVLVVLVVVVLVGLGRTDLLWFRLTLTGRWTGLFDRALTGHAGYHVFLLLHRLRRTADIRKDNLHVRTRKGGRDA
jgi:hypothetical protein